jgi:putative ubiquitin-RnfH superfamily antitoxin RatB of RatAB toxin-antitoxin module
MAIESITVEVVYATTSQQPIFTLEMNAGSTVEQAITQARLMQVFPEIDLSINKVGIFGHIVNLSKVLQSGDRVEIYRPLQVDPRLARRERVRQSMK